MAERTSIRPLSAGSTTAADYRQTVEDRHAKPSARTPTLPLNGREGVAEGLDDTLVEDGFGQVWHARGVAHEIKQYLNLRLRDLPIPDRLFLLSHLSCKLFSFRLLSKQHWTTRPIAIDQTWVRIRGSFDPQAYAALSAI